MLIVANFSKRLVTNVQVFFQGPDVATLFNVFFENFDKKMYNLLLFANKRATFSPIRS